MMRMPPAMVRAKNSPDETRQRHQEKSAEINKDLRNGGSGGYQRPNRILLADTECPGQKTWSHHDCAISLPAGTVLFLLLSVFTLIFRCSISQARIWADFQTPAGFD
jgi:hypothetical protein